MATEIDSLEIAIQAQAKDANRALANLEKHLGTIETKLTRVMTIAQGGVSLKGVNFDKLFNDGKITKTCEKASKQWSQAIIKNFNIGRAGKDAEKEIENLTLEISNLFAKAKQHSSDEMGFVDTEEMTDAIRALDKLSVSVLENGSKAKETAKEYQELYEWVKKSSKVPISEATANSLGDDFTQRKGILRQKVYKSKDVNADSEKSVNMNKYFSQLMENGWAKGIPELTDVDTDNVENEFEALSSALNKFYEDYRMFDGLDTNEVVSTLSADFDEFSKAIANADSSADGFTNNLKELSDIGKSFSESFGIDTSGFEKAKNVVKETSDAIKSASGTSSTPTSSKPKQENTQSISEQSNALFDRFKDVGKNFDTSKISNSVFDVEKEIAKAESALESYKAKYEEMLASNESDTLGKSFANMVAKIQQATNKLDALKQKLADVEKANAKAIKNINVNRDDGRTYKLGDGDMRSDNVRKQSPQIKGATFKQHSGDVSVKNKAETFGLKVKIKKGNEEQANTSSTSNSSTSAKTETNSETNETDVENLASAYDKLKSAVEMFKKVFHGVPEMLMQKLKMPEVENADAKQSDDSAKGEPVDKIINTDGVKSVEDVEGKISATESSLERFKSQLEALKLADGFDENSEEAKKLQSNIDLCSAKIEQYQQLIEHLKGGGTVETFQPTATPTTGSTETATPTVSNTNINELVSETASKIQELKQSLADNLKVGIDESQLATDIAEIQKLEKELKQYQKLASSMQGMTTSLGTIDTSSISGKLEYAKQAVKEKFTEMKSSIANSKLSGAVSTVFGGVKKAIGGVTSTLSGAKKGVSGITSTFGKFSSGISQAFPLIGKLSGGIGSLTKRFSGGMIRQLVFKTISAINSALSEGVGYLSQYSGSFNNAMSSMTSSLSYVRNALTSAFSPIIEVVAPYISQLLDMIAEVSNKVGQFFSALTGKSYAVQGKKTWTDYGASVSDAGTTASDGLDDATESAEDFNDYTLGIDELNVQPSSDTSSSSGSGSGSSGTGNSGDTGTDVSSMFDTVSIDSGISKLAEQIRTAWASQDWKSLGTILGTKVNEAINSIDFGGIGSFVGTAINGAVQTAYYFLDTVDFVNIGSKLAEFLNNALENIDFTFIGRLFIKQFTIALDTLLGFLGNLDWGLVASSLSDLLIGMMDETSDWIQSVDWASASTTFFSAIWDFITGIDWSGLFSSAFTLIGSALGGIGSFIGQALKNAWTSIKEGFSELGSHGWSGFLEGILNGIKAIGTWIVENIWNPFKEAFCSAFEIHSPSKKMKELGGFVIEGLLEGISSLVDTVTTIFQGIWTAIQTVFEVVAPYLQTAFSAVLPFFQELWAEIQMVFEVVAPWFQTIFQTAVTVIETVWGVVAPWFSTIWEGIKTVFSVVAPWFETIFGGAVTVIQTVWSVVSTFFTTVWEAIQLIFTPVITWFSEHFQGAYDAIVAVWQFVSDWFNEKWTKIKEVFEPVAEWFKKKFTTALDNIKSAWAFVKTWATEKWTAIKEPFKQAHEWFRSKFATARELLQKAWDGISTWASGKWAEIKAPFEKVADWFGEAFGNAFEAISEAFKDIKKTFKSIAKNIIKPIGSAVNGVINGINWILEKVGSDTPLDTWNVQGTIDTINAFKTGSNGLPQDTVGLVNDQTGNKYKELIVPKHGKPFIPQGRNVVLPMEKGTKIMPANQTADLMSSMNGMPKFATGIGDFFGSAWDAVKTFTGNVADYVDNPSGILQIAVDKFTDISDFFGLYGTMATSAVSYMVDHALSYVKKLLESIGGGVEKAVKWAIEIANDNSHGYDQGSRWGNPDYDCSSLVISAFEQAGIKLKSAGATYTGNMYGCATSIGFSDVTGSTDLSSGSGMKRGDILLNQANHTAMYIGDGQIVQASCNENGDITGGQSGDQTGSEIAVRSYYNYPWDNVLRYSKAYKDGIGTIMAKDVFPMFAKGGFPEDGLFMANSTEMVGQFSGRNAVVNNEQIVEGISQGVYKAVVSANNENTQQTNLLNDILDAVKQGKKIVVDGRELTKAVNNRNARNGFSFT